eukprot:10196841-Heterocapsa_arctica.AAC.1
MWKVANHRTYLGGCAAADMSTNLVKENGLPVVTNHVVSQSFNMDLSELRSARARAREAKVDKEAAARRKPVPGSKKNPNLP